MILFGNAIFVIVTTFLILGYGYLQGDFDFDGDIDGADLSVFASAFGSTGGSVAPDFDFDGDVDGADLVVFAQNFGKTYNLPVPIPEPSTLFLIGSGIIGLAGLRKKFRKSTTADPASIR